MTTKDKETEKKMEEGPPTLSTGKQKKRGKWVVLGVLSLILIASLVAVFGFNLWGLKDKIALTASNWPIVGGLIKPPEAEETPELPLDTVIETLEAKIEALESTMEKQVTSMAEQDEKIILYIDEINRLKTFEDSFDELQADKEAFQTMLLTETEADFTKFYENIHPELAADMYAEIAKERYGGEEVRKYINTFTIMDEGDAAKIMEEMITSDLKLVVDILYQMNADSRGKIMAEMEASNGAIVAKRMAAYLNNMNPITE